MRLLPHYPDGAQFRNFERDEKMKMKKPDLIREKYLVCPRCGMKIYDIDYDIREQDLRCRGCGLDLFLLHDNSWLAIQFKVPMVTDEAAMLPV